MLEFPKQYIIDLHVKINEIDNIARFLLKRKFQNYFLVSLWDFCNDSHCQSLPLETKSRRVIFLFVYHAC